MSSEGREGNGGNFPSQPLTISADGRYVGFISDASNLVRGDTNGQVDVFVHDSVTGATTRASVDAAGDQGTGKSGLPSLSASGLYVVYATTSAFSPVDANEAEDVYRYDRSTAKVVLVSESRYQALSPTPWSRHPPTPVAID